MINLPWKRACSRFAWFWPFSVVFISNFKLKTSCFPVKCPQNDHSDHCFPYEINWCHWVPFWWYKYIRMIQMIEMPFPEFFVLLQKTLAAHISAPRRGTVAVQYSKSSSGVPLCTQTSSWPWGSIIRAPEPQKWGRFENFQIFKISHFWPKNQFFGIQKAVNGWRTSLSSIIHWKYAVGGQNWWKNCQFTGFFHFFPFFLHFFQFFWFLTTSEVEIQCKKHSEIDIWIFWEDFEVENQIWGEYKKDAHASVRLVKFWVFDFGALVWIFLEIFCHFSAQN